MSEPKVFAPGTLTLAVAHDAMSVACSHVNLDMSFVKSLALSWDAESKALKAVVEFYRSNTPETSLQIEEVMRSVRSLGWVDVRN